MGAPRLDVDSAKPAALTAVRLVDEMKTEMDELAVATGQSRSELIRAALAEYLERHALEEAATA